MTYLECLGISDTERMEGGSCSLLVSFARWPIIALHRRSELKLVVEGYEPKRPNISKVVQITLFRVGNTKPIYTFTANNAWLVGKPRLIWGKVTATKRPSSQRGTVRIGSQ